MQLIWNRFPTSICQVCDIPIRQSFIQGNIFARWLEKFLATAPTFSKKRGERIRCEKTPRQGQSQLDQFRSCDYGNKQSPCRSGPCHRSNTSANEAVALYQLRVWRPRSIGNGSRSAFLGYKRSLRLSAGRSTSRLRLSHLRR